MHVMRVSALMLIRRFQFIRYLLSIYPNLQRHFGTYIHFG